MARFPQDFSIGELHHCVDCNRPSGQLITRDVHGLERWLSEQVWGDDPDGAGDVCPECCDIEAGISPAERELSDRRVREAKRRGVR